MKMKKLNELIQDLGGVFNKLEDSIPVGVKFDGEVFDILLRLEFGQRWVYSEYLELSPNELASIVDYRFKESWNDYVELQLTPKGSEVYQTKEVLSGLEVEGTDTNSVDKVSAFNEDELVDTSGNLVDTERELSKELTRTVTKSLFRLKDYPEIYYQIQENITSKIISDLGKFLTLSVY